MVRFFVCVGIGDRSKNDRRDDSYLVAEKLQLNVGNGEAVVIETPRR